jgi:uncharacterized protein (TIGR00369 family)
MPEPAISLPDTFEGFLNLDWIECTEELAHVRFDVRENLKQPLGLLHGGIYSAVAETLASVATVHGVFRDGMTGAGISNAASFLRPVTGGTLEAICRRRSKEPDRWVWQTDFLTEDRKVCALVEVAIAVRPLGK